MGCFFGDLFSDVRELSEGYDFCGVIAALDFALVGALKGAVDGDDPAWARHLQLEIGVVEDDHELHVAWMS